MKHWLLAALAFAVSALPPVTAQAARSDIGGSFSLVNQEGAKVTEKSFLGKPVLLYFGFTTCPDVCPLDLAKMAELAAEIKHESGIVVTPVFVTIDPERDTPARMKAYVGYFGKDFTGLTGTPAQIADIADKYHVYYKKAPFGDHGNYMMDHSTMLFLLGADGAYLDHYGRALTEAQILPRALAKLRTP